MSISSSGTNSLSLQTERGTFFLQENKQVSPEINDIVIKIQRIWREKSLLQKAASYFDRFSFEKMDKVMTAGTIDVFLPEKFPVVLKKTGFPANLQRLQKKKIAKGLCHKLGLSHLVIPRASAHKSFLIERRLPINQHNTKWQMGLYCENIDLFTPAVKDFAHFLIHSNFFDVTGGLDPFGSISGSLLGRYDNLPLFIEDKKAKIGLIDLEEVAPGISCDYYLCAVELISLFPFHFEEIMQIIKVYHPAIEKKEKSLQEVKAEAIRGFEKIYINHKLHVQKKEISCREPTSLKRLDGAAQKKLRKQIGLKLEALHLSSSLFKGMLGSNAKESLRSLKIRVFPNILSGLYRFLDAHLEANLTYYAKEEGVCSYPHLLTVRTLIFAKEKDPLFQLFKKEIVRQLEKNFPELKLVHSDKLFSEIFEYIVQELLNTDEFSYYNRYFGSSASIIFC